MLRFLLVFALICMGQSCWATIVLSGDSLTDPEPPTGYAGLLDLTDLDVFETIARGGLRAEQYNGVAASDTDDDGNPVFINYGQLVVDLDPATIVFLLGANDALPTEDPAFPDGRLNQFKRNVGGREGRPDFPGVFGLFEASTASRVIVLSLLPVDEAAIANTTFGNNTNRGPGMNQRITDGYNPWLQEQAMLRPNFEYLDLHTQVIDEIGLDNWKQDYLVDGLHLSAIGNQWLANKVAAAAVPEPSSALNVSLLTCIFGGLRWSRRKR